MVLFLVLPVTAGGMGWYLANQFSVADNNKSAAEQISGQKTRLSILQKHVNNVQRQSEASLDALSLQMAGLDKSEFDFTTEPALGGANTGLDGRHLDIVDLKDSIDRVAENLSQERMELGLLENVMLDKDLKQSMDPKGWPVKRGYISSAYGYRSDPFTGKKVFHKGVDIPSAKGSPIHALAAGVVTHAENRDGFGNTVEIDHGNGYSTRYAHISKLVVKTGDRIDQDQVIAEIGSTGRSTGPHLHLEMFKDGRRFNPRKRLYSARKAKDH